MSLADNLDLDACLAGASHLMPATEANYAQYLKAFCVFHDVPFIDGTVPANLMNDVSVAKFVFYMGDKHEWKPHTLKSMMAALGSQCVRHGIANFRDVPHEWNKTTLAVLVSFICFQLFLIYTIFITI